MRCSRVGEGELALVDEQAEVDLAGDDGVLDLIERRGDRLEIRLEQPQREVRAGEQPGIGDALSLDVRSRASVLRATRRGP